MNDVLSRAEIYPRLSRVHTYDDGNAIADETARSVYKRNLVALRSYADGVAVVKICDAFGASRQRLNQLVKRHERLGRRSRITRPASERGCRARKSGDALMKGRAPPLLTWYWALSAALEARSHRTPSALVVFDRMSPKAGPFGVNSENDA